MRAVDVGCGGGTVTLELADRVAPATVVGLDMDEIKLGLAAGEAARRGIANAEFRTADVTAWDEPDSYDLVCTRFVLQHLRDPAGLLRRMWAAVRPGGVLVVEDADFRRILLLPTVRGARLLPPHLRQSPGTPRPRPRARPQAARLCPRGRRDGTGDHPRPVGVLARRHQDAGVVDAGCDGGRDRRRRRRQPGRGGNRPRCAGQLQPRTPDDHLRTEDLSAVGDEIGRPTPGRLSVVTVLLRGRHRARVEGPVPGRDGRRAGPPH